VAIESNSSKKITERLHERAASNIALMRASLSPWYLDRTSEGRSAKNCARASQAAACAKTVYVCMYVCVCVSVCVYVKGGICTCVCACVFVHVHSSLPVFPTPGGP